MTIRDRHIAAIAWEANRAYCAAIGDPAQPPWDEAPAWEQLSALDGVAFHRERPDATDAECHELRLGHEAEEGWAFGEDNPVRKTHPFHCPYDQLPEDQRRKYRLFRAVVRTFLDDTP
jgi:hypothetical protein